MVDFLIEETEIVASCEPLVPPVNQLVVNSSPLVTSLVIYVSVPCSEPPSASVPCPSRLLVFCYSSPSRWIRLPLPEPPMVGRCHQRFSLRIVAECRLDGY